MLYDVWVEEERRDFKLTLEVRIEADDPIEAVDKAYDMISDFQPNPKTKDGWEKVTDCKWCEGCGCVACLL